MSQAFIEIRGARENNLKNVSLDDQKIPDEFDFSLFPSGSEQSVALNEALNQAAEGFRRRERRKVGIEELGLHLLLACIFEAVPQRYWTRSSVK